MQNAFYHADEEDYFANASYSKNIESVLPTSELLISFKTTTAKTKRPCYLYVEKLDFKGLIQIRLTEKCDKRRMYITTVDSGSFAELKQEQSLHVTFSGFIDNLVHLLKDCQAGKLEIVIIQLSANSDGRFSPINLGNGKTQNDYQLQFLELRPFKNLVHLCLPCRLAPLNIVLFYLSNILETMQKKVVANEYTVQQLQHDLLVQQNRNEQLEEDNNKLRESLQENAHITKQRHIEEMQQLQEGIQKANEQRRNDNERNRKTIATLQAQIDKINIEKDASLAARSQESKRIESLREELSNANSQISQLRLQKEQLQSEIVSLKNEERKVEMHLSNARKHINEQQDKINKHDKNMADIIADLEAEKNISQTKRKALEIASEEISKANEIIYKQAQELLKLKTTIEWRTEIAIQQEKAIKEKEIEISNLQEELKQMKIIVSNLREEVPQQLESLRKFSDSLEAKYREEINLLRETLECMEQPQSTQASSRPSFFRQN